MKRKTILKVIRILFYLLAFIYLLISEVKEEYSFIFCPFKGLFDIDCYMCGMTRAFISIFHFDVLEAIKLNPLVIVIYPTLVFIALEDTFVIIKNLIFKKEEYSYLEYLFKKLC